MNTTKNNTDDQLFSSEENLVMYYHTSMRNVALFTSLSLTSLIASFSYLKNNKYLYNLEGITLYIISIVFIAVTLLICDRLIITIKEFYNKKDNKKDNKSDNNEYIELLSVPRVLFYVNVMFLFISTILFFTVLYKNIIHKK